MGVRILSHPNTLGVRLIEYSTAELAVGVLIICFPTLPGILQRRTSKPSASIINGSDKNRSTISGSKKRYSGNPWPHDSSIDEEYYELTKGSLDASHVRVPQSAIVNEIRGGKDDYTSYGLRVKDKDKTTPTDGIMKVTEIKQSEGSGANVTSSGLRSMYDRSS